MSGKIKAIVNYEKLELSEKRVLHCRGIWPFEFIAFHLNPDSKVGAGSLPDVKMLKRFNYR